MQNYAFRSDAGAGKVVTRLARAASCEAKPATTHPHVVPASDAVVQRAVWSVPGSEMNDQPNAAEAPSGETAEDGGMVLDANALARLRELDPDGRHGVLGRVFGTFDVSLQRTQVQLRDRLAAGDFAGAGALAHTLKSSSASVGALELSELCARLERTARAGQTESVPELVEAVLRESARVAVTVRAMLRP